MNEKNQFYLDSMEVHFTDEQLMKHIESEHRNARFEAAESGKVAAWKEKPAMNDKRLIPFITNIKGRYQALMSEVNNRIQASIHKKHQEYAIDEVKEKNRNLELEKSRLQRQVNSTLDLEARIPVGLCIQLGFAIILSVVIAFAELVFISKSLQLIGGGLLTNIFLAAGLSGGISLIAHFGGQWIQSLENKWQRRGAITLILFILTGVFFLLARLRQAYFTEVNVELPIWVFICVNLIFFLGIFLISRYLLSPLFAKTQSAFEEYRRLKGIARKRNRLASIEAEIDQNTETLNRHRVLRTNIIAFAQSCEELVQSYYLEAVSAYVEANAKNRIQRPSCLNDSPETLKSYYTNLEIK
ncbi:MAG: hypothetical protein JJ975_15910 [Bacteroidia bacterium]|nr:hypothetical protein [Bacteroidia bacterium]